jgi:hypothetical protein
VQLTQFIYPNGQPKPVEFEASEGSERMAAELTAVGWRFECECNPRTQAVMLDCCDADGQLACKLVPNGPDVPPALEALVAEAWAEWVKRGRPAAV